MFVVGDSCAERKETKTSTTQQGRPLTSQKRNETTSYFGEVCAMAAKKLSTDKIITGFSGDGDVAAWLAKVELVAKLTGEKDLATLIPLYLEGSALALYLELAEEKRADAALLKKELLRAFSDG